MALGGLSDVLRGRAGGHDADRVFGHYAGGQAEAGAGVEGAEWVFGLRGRGAVCGHGDYCEFFDPGALVRHVGGGFGADCGVGKAYLYDNDDRFFPGWRLDTSWILCTVSWSVMVLLAGFIVGATLLLPTEGGYELIPGEE